jgi:hypothetical protein
MASRRRSSSHCVTSLLSPFIAVCSEPTSVRASLYKGSPRRMRMKSYQTELVVVAYDRTQARGLRLVFPGPRISGVHLYQVKHEQFR